MDKKISAQALRKATDFFKDGKFAEALDTLKPIISQDGDNPRAFILASRALRGSGDAIGAAEIESRALSLFPDDPTVIGHAAALLNKERRYKNTMELIGGAFSRGIDDPELYIILSNAQRAMKLNAEADKTQLRALERFGDNVRVISHWCSQLQKQNRHHEIVELLQGKEAILAKSPALKEMLETSVGAASEKASAVSPPEPLAVSAPPPTRGAPSAAALQQSATKPTVQPAPTLPSTPQARMDRGSGDATPSPAAAPSGPAAALGDLRLQAGSPPASQHPRHPVELPSLRPAAQASEGMAEHTAPAHRAADGVQTEMHGAQPKKSRPILRALVLLLVLAILGAIGGHMLEIWDLGDVIARIHRCAVGAAQLKAC